MEKKILYNNKWLSLIELKDINKGIKGYICSHETRCNGKIVAILPYRSNNEVFEYLLRNEITPCWGIQSELSSITGGWEGGDIKDDTVKELKEEGGYKINKSELIDLGESYASKSSDTVYSLFSVDLTGIEQGKAEGDGSELEKIAECIWKKEEELIKSKDPQVAIMFIRLKEHIKKRRLT